MQPEEFKKFKETAQFEQLSLSEEEHQSSEEDKDYGSPIYWQKRYKIRQKERYQWLEDYQALKGFIESSLKNKNQPTILNIGCGNSQIQDQMYEAGYTNITNNDISTQVIQQMQCARKLKNYPLMKYDIMDVTKMTYQSKSFDLIIDKSTIDALLCSQHPYMNTARMLEEVYRVLKDDGVYLIISYGEPDRRLEHLKREHVNFEVETERIQKMAEHGKLIHWVYISKKNIHKEQRIKNEKWKNQFYQNLEELQKNDYGMS